MDNGLPYVRFADSCIHRFDLFCDQEFLSTPLISDARMAMLKNLMQLDLQANI